MYGASGRMSEKFGNSKRGEKTNAWLPLKNIRTPEGHEQIQQRQEYWSWQVESKGDSERIFWWRDQWHPGKLHKQQLDHETRE